MKITPKRYFAIVISLIILPLLGFYFQYRMAFEGDGLRIQSAEERKRLEVKVPVKIQKEFIKKDLIKQIKENEEKAAVAEKNLIKKEEEKIESNYIVERENKKQANDKIKGKENINKKREEFLLTKKDIIEIKDEDISEDFEVEEILFAFLENVDNSSFGFQVSVNLDTSYQGKQQILEKNIKIEEPRMITMINQLSLFNKIGMNRQSDNNNFKNELVINENREEFEDAFRDNQGYSEIVPKTALIATNINVLEEKVKLRKNNITKDSNKSIEDKVEKFTSMIKREKADNVVRLKSISRNNQANQIDKKKEISEIHENVVKKKEKAQDKKEKANIVEIPKTIEKTVFIGDLNKIKKNDEQRIQKKKDENNLRNEAVTILTTHNNTPVLPIKPVVMDSPKNNHEYPNPAPEKAQRNLPQGRIANGEYPIITAVNFENGELISNYDMRILGTRVKTNINKFVEKMKRLSKRSDFILELSKEEFLPTRVYSSASSKKIYFEAIKEKQFFNLISDAKLSVAKDWRLIYGKIFSSERNAIPAEGVSLNFSCQGNGPYYFDNNGKIDLSRKVSNKDGKFVFFNADTGLCLVNADIGGLELPSKIIHVNHDAAQFMTFILDSSARISGSVEFIPEQMADTSITKVNRIGSRFLSKLKNDNKFDFGIQNIDFGISTLEFSKKGFYKTWLTDYISSDDIETFGYIFSEEYVYSLAETLGIVLDGNSGIIMGSVNGYKDDFRRYIEFVGSDLSFSQYNPQIFYFDENGEINPDLMSLNGDQGNFVIFNVPAGEHFIKLVRSSDREYDNLLERINVVRCGNNRVSVYVNNKE